VLEQTLQGYDQNNFLQNLLNRVPFPFAINDVEAVVAQYFLGTVCGGYRSGAVTFPFIDVKGNIRAIQVKEFDDQNHTAGTDFLHSILNKEHIRNNEDAPDWLQAYNQNETKVTCLFGEHLLNQYPCNPVALVEAPKTAIYSTLYFGFPQQPRNLLWLAVYNLSSLNLPKCRSLHRRDVYLFPDLSRDGSAFRLWTQRAKELTEMMPGTRYTVSGLLEDLAPDDLRNAGADIADILIGLDWRLFRKPKQTGPAKVESEKSENSEAFKTIYFLSTETEQPALSQQFSEIHLPAADERVNFDKPETKERECWDQEIADLSIYFARIQLPSWPLKLNRWSTVTNASLFVDSHLSTLKANKGKRNFFPYLHRLKELRQILTTNLK
jgi:hypothetical protein